MKDTSPCVSIGLPVFNGEQYLAEAIESFLSQSFSDFELILSDNASTDSTREICQDFVSKDSRIRYTRNETNIGATRNHNLVFKLSKGKYFKWAGHDDLYDPDYLLSCVKVLDSEPTAVLCYPKTIIIDEYGNETSRYYDDLDLSSPFAHERFRRILNHSLKKLLNPSLGLTKSSNLSKTGLEGNYFAADRVVLAELCLQGRLLEIPEYLFYRRICPDSSSQVFISDETMAIWVDPTLKNRVPAPRWRRFLGNLNGIRRTKSLKPVERILCYKEFWSFYLSPQRLSGASIDIRQLLRNIMHV